MEDRLRKFARLVEIGTFTRAAEEMHISQPALTFAIGKLERELGVRLVERSHRQFNLTEAGELAYQTALAHRALTEGLIADLHDVAGRRPRATIGMIDSIAVALCDNGELLSELEQAADVSIVVNNSRFLRDAIEHGTLDLAFVVSDDYQRPGLEVQVAGTETLRIVCQPQRQAEIEQQLASGKLADFIAYNQESVSYQLIHHALMALEITPHTVLHSTSPDVMLRMVLRGRGVAALPELLTNDLLSRNKLATPLLNGRSISVKRPIQLIRPRNKTLPAPVMHFAKMAKQLLTQ